MSVISWVQRLRKHNQVQNPAIRPYRHPPFKSIRQFIKSMPPAINSYKQSVHSFSIHSSAHPIHSTYPLHPSTQSIQPAKQPRDRHHLLGLGVFPVLIPASAELNPNAHNPHWPCCNGDSPVCTEVCLWRDSLQTFLLALLRDSCLLSTSEFSCNSEADVW
jgi:hypothetical protein